MSKYASKSFWIDTADRAVSTFAQGTLGAILASSVVNLIDLDLAQSAGVGALSALVSVLQSVAGRGGSNTKTPDTLKR
jgi:hypothetical protein